jgi:Cu(I)/Ag(I) efflux system membrane fusion protein
MHEKHKQEKSGGFHETNKEIQYWTCSMHPEVKAEQQANCPICAMALMPVYKSTASTLHLSEQAILLAGIKLMPIRKQQLYKEIRAVGEVAYDPELVIAQEEYLNALNMQISSLNPSDPTSLRVEKMIAKAKYKLRLLGMDESEIQQLTITKEVQTSLIIPEKETWIYADVFETDFGWIKRNQNAAIKCPTHPGEEFYGTVKSINPIINDKTRSVQVRIRLSNPNKKLMPGMYVDVHIMVQYRHPSSRAGEVITIPKAGVLDTGDRKVVWVHIGDGNFEPRQVQIGPEGIVADNGHEIRAYPVLKGLEENEMIVTNGNFLLDSESQITGVAALVYSGAIGIQEESND